MELSKLSLVEIPKPSKYFIKSRDFDKTSFLSRKIFFIGDSKPARTSERNYFNIHGNSESLKIFFKLANRKVPQKIRENCTDEYEKLRGRLGLAEQVKATSVKQFFIQGKEELYGLLGEWSFAFDTAGRFWEQYAGKELSYESGYDGSFVWQSDHYGHCFESDMDEKESSLLSAWIRSGYWLMPSSHRHMDIREGNQSDIASRPDLPLSPDEYAFFIMKLKTGKVEAFVFLKKSSGLPERVVYSTYGEYDVWELKNWQKVLNGSDWLFPTNSSRISKTNDLTLGTFESIQKMDAEEFSNKCSFPASGFREPTAIDRSREVVFDETVSPHLEVTTASSDHILVRPLINGEFHGYFILDSGASGFTVSKDLADQLKLPAFGQVNICGLEGTVLSKFRQANSFQLGPLSFSNPTFLEMETVGLVAGYETQVSGICGYDIFANSVVEMRTHSSLFPQMGAKKSNLQISLFSPASHKLSVANPNLWEPIKLLCNVPHLSATVHILGQNNQQRQYVKANSNYSPEYDSKYGKVQVNLMVDSGAGGSDIIFVGRAGDDPFFKTMPTNGYGKAKGVGGTVGEDGERNSVEIRMSTLEKVSISSCNFLQVSGVFLPHSSSSLKLSHWVSGLLCLNLLKRCSLVVFDYRKKRMLLIQSEKGMCWPELFSG